MARATRALRGDSLFVRRFAVEVIEGPDRGARRESTAEELTIGSAEGALLQLSDPAVSRHHCTLRVTDRGLELRDLGSTNGTFIGETELVRGFVTDGGQFRVGTTTIQIAILGDEIEEPLARRDGFGRLIGSSAPMRRMYSTLERCATSDATVLIEGETGTGKELVAEAIHQASARRDRPFVIVDCGALPLKLTESELFGHVRGSFTGADSDRIGAFEAAEGGTIFLDEIGELALELQPLLLRALESRTIRVVGTNQQRPIDVRVVAASHRDLRVEVNARRFRPDLYYRLDVLHVTVPSLAERAEDIPRLATLFWKSFHPDRDLPADVVKELARQRWPGNVRELRNAVERAALVGWPATSGPVETLSYTQAKDRASRAWEVRWIRALLAAHDHNVSRAARAAQMARSHLRDLIARYELGRKGDDATDDDAPAT